jgi:hypothetical protein
MVKWKCKRSGNIISLDESETPAMLKHFEYEQVVEEVVVEEPKKMGRPRKVNDNPKN